LFWRLLDTNKHQDKQSIEIDYYLSERNQELMERLDLKKEFKLDLRNGIFDNNSVPFKNVNKKAF